MTQRNKFTNAIILGGAAYTLLAISMPLSSAQANTISYTLDNIFLDATNSMTGTFEWTYSEGDFDNGTGLFSELFIPFTSRTLADLMVTFDVKKSIEFSLIQNLDGDGVDITLVFATPLSPTQSSLLDLTAPDGSKYSIGGSGTTKLFVSGSISPVPEPTALQGDLNADGFVGVDDLNIVLVNWNQSVSPGDLLAGDPTGEGFVGVDDLNIVLVNWNNGTPPGAGTTIPEPATMSLLGMSGVALLGRRRRR